MTQLDRIKLQMRAFNRSLEKSLIWLAIATFGRRRSECNVRVEHSAVAVERTDTTSLALAANKTAITDGFFNNESWAFVAQKFIVEAPSASTLNIYARALAYWLKSGSSSQFWHHQRLFTFSNG